MRQRGRPGSPEKEGIPGVYSTGPCVSWPEHKRPPGRATHHTNHTIKGSTWRQQPRWPEVAMTPHEQHTTCAFPKLQKTTTQRRRPPHARTYADASVNAHRTEKYTARPPPQTRKNHNRLEQTLAQVEATTADRPLLQNASRDILWGDGFCQRDAASTARIRVVLLIIKVKQVHVVPSRCCVLRNRCWIKGRGVRVHGEHASAHRQAHVGVGQ